MTRPEPPPLSASLVGTHEYVAWPVEKGHGGLEWVLARPRQPVSGRPAADRCRFGSGPRKSSCGAPAAAWLNRGTTRPIWWAYCARHLFGRWIEDGQMMAWKLRPRQPEPAAASSRSSSD